MICAWQDTIHIGMAAWKQIFKGKRSAATVHRAIANFSEIWSEGGVFYEPSLPMTWHVTPPAELLLAEENDPLIIG